MTFTKDPFFWALISAFGLIGSYQIVGVKKLGRHPLFGVVTVAPFTTLVAGLLYRLPKKERGAVAVCEEKSLVKTAISLF